MKELIHCFKVVCQNPNRAIAPSYQFKPSATIWKSIRFEKNDKSIRQWELKTFVVSLSEAELAKVIELPHDVFQIEFLNGERAILECYLDAEQDVEWSFSDSSDNELASIVGKAIDNYYDFNR